MTTAYLNSSCNHAYLRQSGNPNGILRMVDIITITVDQNVQKLRQMFWEVYDLMFRVVDGLHQNK